MCWRHVSCIFFVNIFSSGNLNVLNARRKDGMLLIIYALWYSVRNIGMGYISWSWFFMNFVTQVYFQYTPALQYNLFVNQTAQWRKLELRISYTVAAPSSPPTPAKGNHHSIFHPWVSQLALVVKNPLADAGDVRDVGSNPGWGGSLGEGDGNPLQ